MPRLGFLRPSRSLMSHSIAVRPATPADLSALQGFHGALCAAERVSGYDDILPRSHQR
jgi:hypothetical protein